MPYDPDDLVRHIDDLQSRGDGFYPAGLFPCPRTHRYARAYQREDANLFFTVITLFVLRTLADDPSARAAPASR